MLQGLKTTDRQRVVVEDYVVRGKETNVHCPISSKQIVCPNDTIPVELFMNEQLLNGESDMFEYIRTRPKVGNHHKAIHNGPKVNEFGIPLDLIMEINPGDLRTKGQKLKSIAPTVAGIGNGRLKKERIQTKLPQCFKKDSVEVATALGLDPKQRRDQKQKMQRLKDKTDLLIEGNDMTLGTRKKVTDRQALKTIRDRIELLQQALITYKKDPKKFDIRQYLKEHTEIINRAVKNLSKEAKGRDITKDILQEHTELIHQAQIAIKTCKKQQQKVKVTEQKKRINLNATVCKSDKEAINRDLYECYKENKDVVLMNEFLTAADMIVPRPYEFHVPRGAVKEY